MHDPHGRAIGERVVEPRRQDTVKFDGRHATGAVGQGAGELTRARADLQDVVGRTDVGGANQFVGNDVTTDEVLAARPCTRRSWRA